jgi:hypothetical protein
MHGLSTMAHINRQREALLNERQAQAQQQPPRDDRAEFLTKLGQAAVNNLRASVAAADEVLAEAEANGVVAVESVLLAEARALVAVYDAVRSGEVEVTKL